MICPKHDISLQCTGIITTTTAQGATVVSQNTAALFSPPIKTLFFMGGKKIFHVAIWCPFECVSWMRGKHCVIGLGWEPMIRATRLWNHYTSHTQWAKLLQQWTQKLCAVSPAWDETNDSCGHIYSCSTQGKKEVLVKVKTVTLFFELLKAASSRQICTLFTVQRRRNHFPFLSNYT